jgi:hypothetical protein
VGEGREGRGYTQTDGGNGEERNEGKKKKKLRWGRDRRKEGRKGNVKSQNTNYYSHLCVLLVVLDQDLAVH